MDAKGTVHYSNAAPPKDAKATVVDVDARAGPPSAESQECYEGWDGGRSYIYFPTPADPFTTTVVVGAGRIRAIERVRKF